MPIISRALGAALTACFCLVVSMQATPTPLTEKLSEEKETTITCQLDAKSKKMPRYSKDSPPSLKDGEYSYNLWLPKGYEAEANRKWPCVFIASPSGKANMGAMAKHLKESGYVVVMMQDSSNKGLNKENFLSAHDDVITRVRIAEGLKFATGFSGGSRASGVSVQLRPGFAGLFQQGAGFPYDSDTGADMLANFPKKNFCIVSSIGSKDTTCCSEWPRLISSIPARMPYLPIISDQGHGWSSPEIATRAFLFMEASTLQQTASNADVRATTKSWLPCQAQIIKEMPDLVDRINFAGETLKAAAKQNFSTDPAMVDLKAELQKWQKDPAAANEIKADDALWKLFFKNLKTSMPGKKRAEEFKNLAKRYEGTIAAKKAATFADGCEKIMKDK